MHFKLRRIDKNYLTIAIFAIASLLFLLFANGDLFYTALPILVSAIIMLWLFLEIYRIDGQIPFFDIGVFCALVIFFYTVFPLINYIIGGFQFWIISEYRLYEHNPTPKELCIFYTRYLIYFFCFAICYYLFRGKGKIITGNISLPNIAFQKKILLIFILIVLYFISLQLITGLNFNFSYDQVSVDKYISIIDNLPRFVVQISVKLRGILFVFKIALLYCVITRCNHKKWRFFLGLWILTEIVKAVFIMGARTELVLFLLAAIFLYHRLIKQISLKMLFIFGLSIFFGFLFLGIFRVYFNPDNAISVYLTANEFLPILINSLDILSMKESGVDFPLMLYFNDFIGLFPPQQVMPFEKFEATRWYMQKIGLEGAALGTNWGVISQAIIGFDRAELVIRGSIIGIILGCFHRWYINNQERLMPTFLYVFLCINIYTTFRNTTFYILNNIFWEFIPFIILISIGLRSKSHTLLSSAEQS